MRARLPLSIIAVAATALVLACSDKPERPPPAGLLSSSSSGSTSSTSSSGGSSSGTSGSSGSTSGGTDAGSSSGDAAPLTCNVPTVAASFGGLTVAQQTLLCDYAACTFGGYGTTKSCPGGKTVKAQPDAQACLADPVWVKCNTLATSDYLACLEKVNADSCNSLATITSDPACAAFKACAL